MKPILIHSKIFRQLYVQRAFNWRQVQDTNGIFSPGPVTYRFICAVNVWRSSEQMQTVSQKQFVSGFVCLLCHFLLRVLLIEELLVIEAWFWVHSGDFAEIKALFRLSENPNTDKKRESTLLPTDTHRQCSLLENSTLSKCCAKRMQLRNHVDT